MCRGISGGQAKRANIAIAMVVDPRVLFLDVRPLPTTATSDSLQLSLLLLLLYA